MNFPNLYVNYSQQLQAKDWFIQFVQLNSVKFLLKSSNIKRQKKIKIFLFDDQCSENRIIHLIYSMINPPVSSEQFLDSDRNFVHQVEPTPEFQHKPLTSFEIELPQKQTKINHISNISFEGVTSKEQEFQDNYESDYSCFVRTFFLWHTIASVTQMRALIKQNDERPIEQKKLIKPQDIKNIKYQDSGLFLGQNFAQYLNSLKKDNSQYQIQISDLYRMIYQQLKAKIWASIAFNAAQMAFKLGFSITLQFLFQSVANGDKQLAYALAFCAGLFWLLSQISRQNGFYQTIIIGTRLKSGLATTLFAKLSGFSQFTYQNSQLSKVVNMLSNDFNIIQLQISSIFIAVLFPFALIAIAIILILRFGWAGIIGVILPIILFPLQNFISKKNGQLLRNVNVRKDLRLQICTQIIEGIKFVKLYGWEMAFKKIIQKYREQQIRDYLWLNFGKAFERALGNCIALWSGFAMFITVHNTSGELSTSIIFASLELMVFLKINIFFFAMGVGFYYQLNVIFERFASVFNIENIQMIQIDPLTKKPINEKISGKNQKSSNLKNREQNSNQTGYVEIKIKILKPIEKGITDSDLSPGDILLRNFNGYWSTTNFDRPSLSNINLTFSKGNFYGICGKIGSGKSGLLAAILSEIPYFSGTLITKGSIVYVQQQPIVFSTTVKENILFGKPFDEKRYKEIIKISCLQGDLSILQNGDQTIVGQRGMTLSGGQKARLALARALYADGNIYLFDDPISAVDSRVAKLIYENVILPLSKQKTLILVTHQVNYLFECDKVIIMEEGSIKREGSPKDLKKELMSIYQDEQKKGIQDKKSSEGSDPKGDKSSNEKDELEKYSFKEQSKQDPDQIQEQLGLEGIEIEQAQRNKPISQLLQRNEEENVKVTLGTYTSYILFKKANAVIFPVTIIFFIGSQLVNTFYIRILADYDNLMNGNGTFLTDFKTYWIVLGVLQILFFILLFIKYVLLSIVVLRSNQKLHQSMIHSLVRCPSSYFDITPTGRLLNNFSNDLGILDDTLAFILLDVIEGPITSIIMLANIFQINPLFIPPGVISIAFLIFFFIYCKPSIIESKQLDLRMKTPVFKMFRQMLSGSVQIRIFGRRKTLLKQFADGVNAMTRALINYRNCGRGYSAYVTYFTNIVLIIGYIIGVWNSTVDTAGLYAISVIFLVQINQQIDWYLKQMIQLQSIMVSVQRAKLLVNQKSQKQLRNQYDQTLGLSAQVKQQQEFIQGRQLNHLRQKGWPENASLEFKNASMRYRKGLPLVLRNVSFCIYSGQKIGIVGRTGAGKSSIVQAIFRICQLDQGSQYLFGNHDATKMGLHSLRQHISVIPQTPFIFKGSIRENLDPFNVRNDEQIWQALEDSDLATSIKNMENKLETNISNSSQVFSVGQKQLLCLARALLKKDNKFLVLDQATSNVDMRTDSFIQNVLKTKFKDTTVITIAHRLDTIADYDKIIVMNKQKIAQFGTPHELIIKGGIFCKMVNHTGKNAQKIRKLARQKYQNAIRLSRNQ